MHLIDLLKSSGRTATFLSETEGGCAYRKSRGTKSFKHRRHVSHSWAVYHFNATVRFNRGVPPYPAVPVLVSPFDPGLILPKVKALAKF